ncbi:MAG: Thiol-disulfide isomerase or thioredoxin, partial [Chitinophagaceae bacterium]|nr:Thiol-disulfide isomerase or thioredoxin [Chitinophagaceae bacterium]
MKKLLFAGFIVCTMGQACTQNPVDLKPFTVKARISNCIDKYLELWLPDAMDEMMDENTDTLWLNNDGYYHLTTYKIKEPCQAYIVSENVQIRDLLIAPGYDLTIIADARNRSALNDSKRVTGIGAGCNYYTVFIDSAWQLRNTGSQNSVAERLQVLKAYSAFRDSAAKAIFLNREVLDPYHFFFYHKAVLDN